MKTRREEGVGLRKKIAKEISFTEEDILWESKQCSLETPEGLFNAVVYCVALRFALRGGAEIYNLTTEQIKIELRDSKKWIIYQERTSKTASGGIRDRKVRNKTVEIPEDDSLGDRCVVKVVELYNSKRDTTVPHFLCRPIAKPQLATKWFSSQRIGINTCKKLVRRMCSGAGIEGQVSNHSLRRTAVSRLAHAGFDDNAISTISGHRSSALQAYKTVSEQDKYAMGRAMHASEAAATRLDKVTVNGLPMQGFQFHGCNVTINMAK